MPPMSSSPGSRTDRPVRIPSYVTPIVRPVPMVWTDNGWHRAG
jgi:hypothetical protein